MSNDYYVCSSPLIKLSFHEEVCTLQYWVYNQKFHEWYLGQLTADSFKLYGHNCNYQEGFVTNPASIMYTQGSNHDKTV